MSNPPERRITCCERERTHLIQGGHGSGGGEYTQDTVVICENCGQFRVSAMKNNVWTEVRFSIWNPDTLAAASKPLERVREDEGIQPRRGLHCGKCGGVMVPVTQGPHVVAVRCPRCVHN
jgi:hypothetical protein